MPQFPAAESTIKQAQQLVGAIDLSAARIIATNVAQSFDAAVAAMGSKQDEILASADTNKQVAQALDALTSQTNADISRRIQEKTGDITSQELTGFLESAKLINAQLLADNTTPIDLGGIVQNLVQQFNKTTDTSQRATLSNAITEVSSKLIGNTQAAIDVQAITNKQQITNELLARLIAGADSKQATRSDVKEKAPTVQQTTTTDISNLSTTLVKALSSVSEKITSAVAPIGTEVSTAALTALTGNAQASQQLINSITSIGSTISSGIVQAIAGTEIAKRYADSRKKAAAAKSEKRDIKRAKKREQRVVRTERRKAQVKRIADKLRAKLLNKLDKKDAKRITALQKANDSIKTAITLGNVIRLATSAMSMLPLLLSGVATIAGTIVTGIATFLGGKVTEAFSSIKTFFTGDKNPSKVVSKSEKVARKSEKAQSKVAKVATTPDKVSRKTDKVNSKTDTVNSKTNKVNSKTDTVNSKTNKVNSKTDKVNSKTDTVNSKTDKVTTKTAKVNSKTDKVTTKTAKVNSKTDKVNSKTDKVTTKTDTVTTKTDTVNSKTDTVNSKTNKVNSKTDKVNSKTDKVNSKTSVAKVKKVGRLGRVGKKLATLLPRIAARHAALTALTVAVPPAAIAANLLATGFDIIDAVKIFTGGDAGTTKPTTKPHTASLVTHGSRKAQKTGATSTLKTKKSVLKFAPNTTMQTNSQAVSKTVEKRTAPQQSVAPNITVQPAPVHVQQAPSSAEHRTTSLDDVGLALLHKQALG